jgi:hypothetical protein
MAFDGKSLDDYVDVAERIAEFRDKHPEGSIQPVDPTTPYKIERIEGTSKDGKPFTATMIVYTAAAYRTPDDKRPGVGCAWEPFPGRTSFTLSSELMNAETSAWGRAIVAALAADAKRGVASKQEVRNRAADRDEQPRRAERGPVPPEQDHWAGQPAGQLNGATKLSDQPGTADEKQLKTIGIQLNTLGIGDRESQLVRIEAIINGPLDGPHKAKDGTTRTRANLSRLEAETVKDELAAAIKAKRLAERAAAQAVL